MTHYTYRNGVSIINLRSGNEMTCTHSHTRVSCCKPGRSTGDRKYCIDKGLFIECIMDSIVVPLWSPLPLRTSCLTQHASQLHVLGWNVRRVAGDSHVHALNLANTLAGVPLASLIRTGKSGLCFLMTGYFEMINCLTEQSQRVWVTSIEILRWPRSRWLWSCLWTQDTNFS